MLSDMWMGAAVTLSVAGVQGGQPSGGANPSNQSLGGAPAGPVAGAATGQPAGGPGAGGPAPVTTAPSSPFGPQFLLLLFLMIGFMFFMQWRQGKAEKKKRADMMEQLTKGDTVQTIGGEIGVVADVREHEVVVKFEEGKARYVKTAILSVVKPAKGKEGATAAIEAKDAKEPARS